MTNGKIIISILAAFFLYFSGFLYPVSASEQPTHEQHDEITNSQNHENSSEFEPGTFIIDHIKDSHEWHLITKSNGEHVSIPLPIIIFSKEKGFHVFMSSRFAHGHSYQGFKIASEGINAGKIVEVDDNGEVKHEVKESGETTAVLPLDFSITKAVIGMFFAAVLLILLFGKMGSIYKKDSIVVPKGLNGFLEPMIIFVRDEIAIPNIGHKKYEKYLPYLLTVFFFILINNLMGLVPAVAPFGANVTGNIAVTMVLALFTFVLTQFAGSRTYWKHIVATPGVPFWLAPIMIPVEIIGMFSKPFALTVRLFANITAGHIVVLSLVSLIFIFKTVYMAPVSIVFVIFMDLLEILVAVLQAYVFTLLSALFIGLAAQEHH